MPDCTLTNSLGDTVTVERGGIGSDNIKGAVEQNTNAGPATVSGANVMVSNPDGQTDDNDTTNSSGQYDIDVDAAAGHTVVVTAEWVDAAGRRHLVRGTCTVT